MARRRRRPAEDYVQYAFTVKSWDYYYYYYYYYEFGTRGPSRHEAAGLHHIATLTLRGRTTFPERFRYPRAVATLSGKADLRPPDHDEARPAIGSVHASDHTVYFYAFVPAEHMAQLVACAASGRTREVWLLGTPLKWCNGTISRVSLTTEVEEDADDEANTSAAKC